MKYWILLFWFVHISARAHCLELTSDPLRIKLPSQVASVMMQVQVVMQDESRQRLEFRAADTLHLQHQLDLATLGLSQPVIARPIAEDANLDGMADHLWLLTQHGQLWRVALNSASFIEVQLMADLSGTDLLFNQAVTLIRARLPQQLAPANWRHLEQYHLLLVGTDPLSDQDVLFNLRFPVNRHLAEPTRLSQLYNRTNLSAREQNALYTATDWQAILSREGWFIRLSGRLSSLPKVIAGVIYAPVVQSSDFCDGDEQQLYAIQLYTAAQIYPHRRLTVPFLPNAQLALQEMPDRSLSLVLQHHGERLVLMSSLLKVSSACHQCTQPLSMDKFPIWQKLATYRDERGAY